MVLIKAVFLCVAVVICNAYPHVRGKAQAQDKVEQQQSVESGRDAILQKLVDRLMVKLEKGEDITDEMESELKKIAIGTQSKKILAQRGRGAFKFSNDDDDMLNLGALKKAFLKKADAALADMGKDAVVAQDEDFAEDSDEDEDSDDMVVGDKNSDEFNDGGEAKDDKGEAYHEEIDD